MVKLTFSASSALGRVASEGEPNFIERCKVQREEEANSVGTTRRKWETQSTAKYLIRAASVIQRGKTRQVRQER